MNWSLSLCWSPGHRGFVLESAPESAVLRRCALGVRPADRESVPAGRPIVLGTAPAVRSRPVGLRSSCRELAVPAWHRVDLAALHPPDFARLPPAAAADFPAPHPAAQPEARGPFPPCCHRSRGGVHAPLLLHPAVHPADCYRTNSQDRRTCRCLSSLRPAASACSTSNR